MGAEALEHGQIDLLGLPVLAHGHEGPQQKLVSFGILWGGEYNGAQNIRSFAPSLVFQENDGHAHGHAGHAGELFGGAAQGDPGLGQVVLAQKFCALGDQLLKSGPILSNGLIRLDGPVFLHAQLQGHQGVHGRSVPACAPGQKGSAGLAQSGKSLAHA